VIGFSGGMDSVCLASLFLDTSMPIIIAHFNHSLRETANRDEEFSRDFAKKRNLPFYSEKGDVHQYAEEHHLSVEESARKMRYRFLFRIAKINKVEQIAVAHHADDQVETVFMHLFRGSGMAGLIGMKLETLIPEFSKDIKLIRPMLTFWRSEIEEYCKIKGLDFVEDESLIEIIGKCDQIIVLTESFPVSVERTKSILAKLSDFGFGKNKLLQVVSYNRVRADIQLTQPQIQEKIGILPIIAIPSAPEQAYQAAIHFQPLVRVQPESLVSQQFYRLADQLLVNIKQ